MAMNFWESQARARRQTALYLIFFVLLAVIAAVVVEFGLRAFAGDQYNPPYPLWGAFFLALTFTVALVQYAILRSLGGKHVAETMGGRKVDLSSKDLKEKQLLNIVQEIALASSLPIPPVYIIQAESINAFAAGLNLDNAIIAVTSGALNQLSRDELQGVIAHEFGHIRNGDMRIGLRLAAMLMGFYFIFYFALRVMQFSQISRGSDRKGAHILIIALIFFIVGIFTWFFGSILKAAVNRQREYLADASSVEFTRSPEGLANALKKIAKEADHSMPKSGMAYSHLYFDARSGWSSLFATHPPLEKRIKAILGSYSRLS